MRNLELLEIAHVSPYDTLKWAHNFAQATDVVYFTKMTSLYQVTFAEKKPLELAPLPMAEEDILCLKYLIFERKVCIVSGSCFYFLDVPVDPNNKNFKVVKFDEVIAAVSWNPTEELVTMAFHNGVIATFAINYETAEWFERGHSNVDAAVPDAVYVGWGSKDTQFTGAKGRVRAKPPIEGELRPMEDRTPVISWRGNGEMFAVNYWKDGKRFFTVFEVPCQAAFRSEDCYGLLPCLAWRPAGNMIATATDINSNKAVVIFEKNGQRRFDFQLNSIYTSVTHIKWSPCGQILSLRTKDGDAISQSIHLFTCSNYTWYPKQRLQFTGPNQLLDFDWLESSTQSTYTLQVLTHFAIVRYTFRSTVHENSAALCGVINGEVLQMTDFKTAVIPPTLSSASLMPGGTINYVTFDGESIALVDSLDVLTVYVNQERKFVADLKTMTKAADFPLARHGFKLLEGNLVEYICEHSNAPSVYAVVDLMGGIAPPSRSVPSYCSDYVKQVSRKVGDVCYTMTLTTNNQFLLNDVKLIEPVNSFIVTDSYLLVTTKFGDLYCVRLTVQSLSRLSILKGVFRRNVEQGAALVCAIPDSCKVVFQMPRGNLETISCRLISIDILDRLLDQDKWEEAIRYIRTEKLNANLLIDLDFDRFSDNISRFVSASGTTSELNNICLEIEDGNVLKTIYENWGGDRVLVDKKARNVFAQILRYFDQIDYSPFITSIMIINFHHFSLEECLVYIQDLLQRSKDDPQLKKSVENAIATLKTYGCAEDKLYVAALLLYDLDLARVVASYCQMDPRVYEPQLDALLRLSEVERRYKISLLAKRPKIAVAYLLRCSDLDQSTLDEFLIKMGVSRDAYETCPSTSPHFDTVSKAFAGDLARRGRHAEAAAVLRKAGLLQEALKQFQAALQWREVIDLMDELKYETADKMAVINKMAVELVDANMAVDAAILYDKHAGNYEMAIKVLLESYHYRDAIHVANQRRRKDIIVANIIPALSNHQDYLKERLTELEQIFDQRRTRLRYVRESKAAKFGHEIPMDAERDSDLFSDAGSTISKSSRTTRSRSSTASSRNRRKDERKKQDLREGGVYEDIALIRSLHLTMKEIYSKSTEVKDCCLFLLQERGATYADIKLVYDLYVRTDRILQEAASEIWPPHFFFGNSDTRNVREQADLENLEHLDEEYRRAPVRPTNWTLDLFSSSR